MDIFGGRRKRGIGIAQDIRLAAAKLVKLGKYSVDSAVYDSLSGGMQVYTTVKQSSQDELSSRCRCDDRNTRFVVVEQINEKREEMRKEMNNIKQEEKVSVHRTKEEETLEQFSDEPLRSSTPELPCRKKIFIRSRL